jgi:hypothetical protein
MGVVIRLLSLSAQVLTTVSRGENDDSHQMDVGSRVGDAARGQTLSVEEVTAAPREYPRATSRGRLWYIDPQPSLLSVRALFGASDSRVRVSTSRYTWP